MNATVLVLLIVAGVLPAAAVIVGLVLLILFLVKSATGAAGGWRALAETYSSDTTPAGVVLRRETVQIGAVVYKRCATLGIAEPGLYVSIGRKTALIPWADFKAMGQATLYWQQMPKFTIGNPLVATVVVRPGVLEQMRNRLPEVSATGSCRG